MCIVSTCFNLSTGVPSPCSNLKFNYKATVEKPRSFLGNSSLFKTKLNDYRLPCLQSPLVVSKCWQLQRRYIRNAPCSTIAKPLIASHTLTPIVSGGRIIQMAQYAVFNTPNLQSAYHQIPTDGDERLYMTLTAGNKFHLSSPFGASSDVVLLSTQFIKV